VCLCICGGWCRWTKPGQPSGMVVMEVNQLTGYAAVDLDDVKRQAGSGLKRVEDKDDKMVMYFDEVCSTLSLSVCLSSCLPASVCLS